MSLDIQSLLNSYASLPQAPNVAGQAANMWSSIPSIHGVDLSNVAPSSLPFQVTAADFAKTPGLPSAAPSSAPSSSGGGGGFFSGLGHDISQGWNWLGSVGHGITGMWQDLLRGGDPVGDVMGLNGKPAVTNAQQADQYAGQQRQLFNTAVDNNLPAPLRGVTKFAVPFTTETLFSPQSLALGSIPIGKIAQVTGITPGLKMGFNAIKSSKVGDAIANNAFTQQLGKNFVKNFGASQAVKDALNNLQGQRAFDQASIANELPSLAKLHGLNVDEMQQIPHMFEGHTVDNPRLQQALASLQDALQNGVGGIRGQVGTTAELNTAFRDKPILQNTIENYFPHRYNNTATQIENALQNAGKAGFSKTGPFNQERVFNTLDEAQAAGLKPEMNPYVAIGQRLNESSKALRNAQTLQQLMDAGVTSTEHEPGMIESSIPQFRGLYIKPADENALKAFLQPETKPGAFLNAFDKGMGLWKTGTLFNPAVHGHNIAYNGMYLGGAKLSDVMDAFKSIRNNPMDNEMYQRALKAGAVSSDNGKFVDTLRNAVESSSPAVGKFKSAINTGKYIAHGSLWDADKAIRTALFKKFVSEGATDAEAAKNVNKFMVDYNNTTPFENQVMTRLFPFYRWMKGNIPLQAEQWVNNTGKQGVYEALKNSTSQGLSGNDTKGGKIDTGMKLPGGYNLMLDPYSPADEPLKMLRDGVLPFMYSKVNPLIKEGVDQATNKAYYPSAPFAPNGNGSMADQSIGINGAPTSFNVGARVDHAAKNLLPIGGGIGQLLHLPQLLNSITGQPQSTKPGNTLPENILEAALRSAGSFPSSDNPTMDNYYQQKDQQSEMQGFLKYLQKIGQHPSKAQTKQAYAKIPFPVQ